MTITDVPLREVLLPRSTRVPWLLTTAVLLLLAATGDGHAASSAQGEGIRVPMKAVTSAGTSRTLGVVTVTDSPHGAVFTPALEGLEPGLHGFHLHANPDCAAAPKDGKMSAAEAAGGHYDPDRSGRHGAPWGDGHRGDLPPLHVDPDGKATQPVLAPRLAARDVRGRSLMVHAGGDNHADHPAPLGGGGARVACGVAP
jgi:superoxide dismutase, Cu-Zn family